MTIDSKRCFVDAVAKFGSFLAIDDFSWVMKQAETLAKSYAREIGESVTQNAINNVRGDWYEWLITVGSIEYQIEKQIENITVSVLASLPNVTSFDCSTLYLQNIAEFVADLKRKTKDISKVSLRSSNPDFVILSFPKRKLPKLRWPIDSRQLVKADEFYEQFVNSCSFDAVLGYVSVKSSLRPDRRLQLPHEGSLLKAIYRHIQTRLWDNNAPGIRYYAATLEFKDADVEALRTVATHSILNVNAKPEAAVDGLHKISSGKELREFLDFILK